MKSLKTLAAVFVGLFVLRYDFWNWDAPTFFWGLPSGLAYHAGYCVLVTLVLSVVASRSNGVLSAGEETTSEEGPQ